MKNGNYYLGFRVFTLQLIKDKPKNQSSACWWLVRLVHYFHIPWLKFLSCLAIDRNPLHSSVPVSLSMCCSI